MGIWYTLVSLVLRAMDLYELLIIVDAVLSWVPSSYGTTLDDIKHAIGTLVDPFVDIFRRMIPPLGAGGTSIDFSPVVAIIALRLIERLVVFILL